MCVYGSTEYMHLSVSVSMSTGSYFTVYYMYQEFMCILCTGTLYMYKYEWVI